MAKDQSAPSQAVSDLLWVVNTPPLVQGANVAARATLDRDAIDSAHLDEFLAAQLGADGYRVGRYFERLLHYWFVHGRGVEVVACLLYTSPSPRDATLSRMPSSA